MKTITFNCEQCGRQAKQIWSQYNKYKHHLCSRNCQMKTITSAKNKVKRNSDRLDARIKMLIETGEIKR